MSHWHYQVMKHPDGTYAIHEYFEMTDGNAWTERPVTVDGETVEDIIETLRLMVIDIGRHGVMEYPKMIPLIERLRNWQTIYPEDEDKPEGSLYLEAANALELLNTVRDKPNAPDSSDTYREG